MAWSDAGQRPEAMPVACTGCDFAVSNRPAVSTPATATYRCRSQSITASGMIYDHVSSRYGLRAAHRNYPANLAGWIDTRLGHTALLESGEKGCVPATLRTKGCRHAVSGMVSCLIHTRF